MKFVMDQTFSWIASVILSAILLVLIIGMVRFLVKDPIEDEFISDVNIDEVLKEEAPTHLQSHNVTKNEEQMSTEHVQTTKDVAKKNAQSSSNTKEESYHETKHPDAHNAHNVYWGYKGPEGPQYWAKLHPSFYLCAQGKHQSPININFAQQDPSLAKIDFVYQKSQGKLFHSGHSVQINVEKENYLIFKGKKFILKQFHFHVPSEHQVKGIKYDGEIHFVHEAQDKSLLVIGVLIEEGSEKQGLEYIFKYMPTPETSPINIPINPKALFPNKTSYYFYEGSLTTPPCTEGVTWIVMSNPIKFSSKQIDALLGVLSFNARPIQPLNKRTVLFFNK